MPAMLLWAPPLFLGRRSTLVLAPTGTELLTAGLCWRQWYLIQDVLVGGGGYELAAIGRGQPLDQLQVLVCALLNGQGRP